MKYQHSYPVIVLAAVLHGLCVYLVLTFLLGAHSLWLVLLAAYFGMRDFRHSLETRPE
jgi:hypothetical protein